MARVGYARISTADQDLDIQIARLKAPGVRSCVRNRIGGFSRGARGTGNRHAILAGADELVVLRLDRLGPFNPRCAESGPRTRRQGSLAARSGARGDDDRRDGTYGDTVLGMVADMELKFIKDRQKAGIEAAKADGAYKGRKKRVNDDEIRRLAALGVSKARSPVI